MGHEANVSFYMIWKLFISDFEFHSDVHAWPALLCLKDHELDYTDLHGPPVKHIDIEFHSIDDTRVQPLSSSSSSHSLSSTVVHDYHAYYEGTQIEPDLLPSELVLDTIDGIGVEGHWVRGPLCSYRIPLPTTASDMSFTSASYGTRVFVPIPASLFTGRECRYFKLKAKVTFEDRDLPTTVAHSGTVKVSIEHLKKEVHMDGVRASLDA